MTPQVLSPCVGVCAIDQPTGWCLGCGRTSEEIASWQTMGATAQHLCWDELPTRLDTLSVRVRLLPWTVDEIGVWVAETLAKEHGTWVTGVPGAVAEFPCGPRYVEGTEQTPKAVLGFAHKASFRLHLHEKLRAFSFGADQPVVLGVPKTRVKFPVAEALTALGEDNAAIDAQFRGDALFDFGLGRESSRFCVRTNDPDLREALDRQCGKGWPEAMGGIGPLLVSHGPHRVVESMAVRIEVCAPIPAPGTVTPPGAHTHFLPQFMTPGEEGPAGLTLPDYALPMAIYYPKTK
ncbi:MAG: DUF1289 domain-containing protein [Pseudomonadota bacterium]